jgi:hypothetical protein
MLCAAHHLQDSAAQRQWQQQRGAAERKCHDLFARLHSNPGREIIKKQKSETLFGYLATEHVYLIVSKAMLEAISEHREGYKAKLS